MEIASGNSKHKLDDGRNISISIFCVPEKVDLARQALFFLDEQLPKTCSFFFVPTNPKDKQHTGSCLVTAELNADLVGALLAGQEADYCYIDGMAVKKTARNKGIGSLLLKSLDRSLQNTDIHKIHLFACPGAHQFYRDNGYKRGEYENNFYKNIKSPKPRQHNLDQNPRVVRL